MSNDKKAKRFNQDKPDMSLLPREACEQEARVWMFGEQKYGRDNWQKLWGDETINICTASLLRHAFAIASGQLIDEESGLSHAAHIRCNAAMILEFEKKQKEKDEINDNNNYRVVINYPTYHNHFGGGTIAHWEYKTILYKDIDKYPNAYVVRKVIEND